MAIHIKVGGVWKELDTGSNGPAFKVGGAWKVPDAIHIRVGGVWKEVWTQAVYNSATVASSDTDPSDAHTEIELRTDGSLFRKVSGVDNDFGSWVTPESYSGDQDHWVRFTQNSGDAPTTEGHTLGTWAKVSGTSSSNRYIRYDVLTSIDKQGNFTVEIATDSGGSNIVGSFTATMDAFGTP